MSRREAAARRGDSSLHLGPARRRTGAGLKEALAGTTPPDDAFARSIAETMSMVTSEVDAPWAGA